MKELTTEEKAKRYDEALERMKSWARGEHPEYFTEAQKAAEFVFPELKESEDEKIRKWILDELHLAYHRAAGDREREDFLIGAIAWLEKQGEQKPNYCHHEVDLSNCSEEYTKGYYDGWNNCNQQHAQLEAEQKPADKVEPKFKIGDLITNGILVGEIEAIHKRGYHVYFGDFYSDVHDADTHWHKWTIQDVKDGDVLCYETKNELRIFIYKNGHIHYHCCYYNGHLTTVDSFFVIQKHLLCYIHPAAKEQRDLLFQKMHEAGYTWDANKKELKKIEQSIDGKTLEDISTQYGLENPFCDESGEGKNDYESPKRAFIDGWNARQEYAWSKEDEDYINDLIEYFSQNDKLKNTKEDIVIWLKSLRPQSYWKPTEKQLHWLKLTIEELTDISTENGKTAHSVLSELLEQLNKL